MACSFQTTGDRKVDAIVEEIARKIGWLEDEIKKKADKRLLDSLLQILSVHGEITNMKYWRRREIPSGGAGEPVALAWEYDASFGVGAPNWTEYTSFGPGIPG